MKKSIFKVVFLLLPFLLCIPSQTSNDSQFSRSNIFLRVFKQEKILEIWEQRQHNGQFIKIQTIPICAASGDLGPKRQQGDYQVPEGFYKIDLFNPNSQYHLSMRVDYPNVSDKIRTHNPRKPGGQIMIHGGCASAGCIAIGNNKIEYLYHLMQQQKRYGQSVLPVHIFPCKMNALRYNVLSHLKRNNRYLTGFWKELETGFDYFEKNRRVPDVTVNHAGKYQLKSNRPLL